MADVRCIIAIGLSGQMGLHGELPWEGDPRPEFRADVERFFDITRGHVLIAGPKTIGAVPAFAAKEMTLRIARSVEKPEDVPMRILIPAFATSELKTAFQIGFLIFIPFVIIDLVVASVLMSMGMMMLSPVLISLPFKLMLFVLVDGWSLLMGTLAASFYT